jgi:hypothetical protein
MYWLLEWRVDALAAAVENPPAGVRIIDVPAIRARRSSPARVASG